MILLLFLLGLALGAPSESPSDENEVKLQLDDRAVKLQHGNCPTFWWSFNGRCYTYVATPMSWSDAEFHCLSQGANLVSIHNMEEENFVRSLIRNFDPAQRASWIGLSDVHREGRWMWSDGSVVRFFNWNAGEPNNLGKNEHCVQNNFGPVKKWNDEPCSRGYPSVCVKRNACV
ncbi:lactose-binding lectin l-2-like [Astatotilapia calliptera]|uniref:C-type lectin domain-containing protein n=1 Tax=Astatotilapia calliptera TaxID=8154 RepID=A0AAX7SKN2_ASTCA|nr:lactose-binding lectin l-2-like [Astatotilapia calliptera]